MFSLCSKSIWTHIWTHVYFKGSVFTNWSHVETQTTTEHLQHKYLRPALNHFKFCIRSTNSIRFFILTKVKPSVADVTSCRSWNRTFSLYSCCLHGSGFYAGMTSLDVNKDKDGYKCSDVLQLHETIVVHCPPEGGLSPRWAWSWDVD